MTTFWDKLKLSYQSISSKTNEVTRIGRQKLEVLALKRDIEKHFVELGAWVYDSFFEKNRKDIFKDEAVVSLIEKIKYLENELELTSQKLEKLRKEDGVDFD